MANNYFRLIALEIKERQGTISDSERSELSGIRNEYGQTQQKSAQASLPESLKPKTPTAGPGPVSPVNQPTPIEPAAPLGPQLPEAFKPRRVISADEPSPSIAANIARNQAAKASIPTNFKPTGGAPLTPEQLGMVSHTTQRPGGRQPTVGANDKAEFDRLQELLGQDYRVLPSNEIANGIRRVAVQRVSDNQVLALDLGIQRNANKLGTVFTEGQLGRQEGAAVIGPFMFGRYNEKNAPTSRVSFQGYTGVQNLQMRVLDAFGAVDAGLVETAQQGWSYALAGHFDTPPISRIPGNAPQQVQQEAMRKVPFLLGAQDPKQKLAPYQAEAIKGEYEKRVGTFIGPVSSVPSESLTWSKLRSSFYAPEKGGGNLVPYADITRTEYVGVPGQQSVGTSMGMVSATALKAKRSVGYGGTEVYPYRRTMTEGGAEVFTRQEPEELRAGDDPAYAWMSALYPGSSERMPAERRNILFTPVPGIPGSHLLAEDPTANRPDAYGNEARITEVLPKANVLDIIGGRTKINMPSQAGQSYPLGERSIDVGTYSVGEKSYPISMQKGTAPFVPSQQWLDVPAYIDPKTGAGVASEEFGVSTKSYIEKIREATGIQDVRRTTVNEVAVGMSGFAQYVGGNRFFDVKALPSPTGEGFNVSYGGITRPIEEIGGEVKGAQVSLAFMGRRNQQQLRGIFGDWASLVGTDEARQLSSYVEKQFLSAPEGQTPQVDYERIATKYRDLTKGLPEAQRFRGSGFGFLQEIFNRTFVDVDTSTPEGALRNMRNWSLYEGGYVGSQQVSMPVSGEQYDLLRHHAIRALQRTNEGMDETAAGHLFEKYFQLGEGASGEGIVVDALRSLRRGGQGTAMNMTFPSAERSFAASVAMPMTAKMIGEGQVNMEAQLAMSETYPEFARELGVAVHQAGRISPVQSAALKLAGFSAFTKSAMEGSPIEPTASTTLTEDQLLMMRDALALKDTSHSEMLEKIGGIVGDSEEFIRFPKTKAVMPSLGAIKTLAHERYGEEVGPLLGRTVSALDKLVQEELSYGEPANYDPVAAGVSAVTPLFRHAEKLFKGKGEIAKHLFSKEPQFSLTTGFAGSLAFGLNETYIPPEIQRHLLGGGGLRGPALNRAMKVFDDPAGIPALALRHPQMGMELLPMQFGGMSMLEKAYGKERAARISSNPRMWGVTLTGQALAQKDIGDFDWDMLTAVAGLRVETGTQEYTDREGNVQTRQTRDVVPLPAEKLLELQKQEIADLQRMEALSFPNQEQRDRSNAIVGSFEDYFKKVEGDKVTQKDIMGSAMSTEKYGWKTVQEVMSRASEIERATTIGMGSPYGVWRQAMVGASQSGTPLGRLGSSQADYSLGLDMWKLGQEAGGARLPAALSKMYAGMKQIKEDDKVVGEEAYVGYSTNVKAGEGDIPEFNRLYLKDVGQGGVPNFLARLVSHAAAPVQEEGSEEMFIRGPEQLAALFAPEEDREMLQGKLEATSPDMYGFAIQKYHRGLFQPGQDVEQYERSLMSRIPILTSSMARATSKSAAGGERGAAAIESLRQFGERFGPEAVNQWQVGAGFHDLLYRMPQGVPSANILTGLAAGSKNPRLRELAKRAVTQMGIPIASPVAPVALPTATETPPVALPVSAEAPQTDVMSVDERQEYFRLAARGPQTTEEVARYNELKPRYMKHVASFKTGAERTEAASVPDAGAQVPVAAGGGGNDDDGGSNIIGELGGLPFDDGGGSGSGGTGSGGGGSGGRPPSKRTANEDVQIAYVNMQRFRDRIPGAIQDLGKFLGMSADDPKPLFMALGQRMQIDPAGTLAAMPTHLRQFIHRMGSVSGIRARGVAALSRSDYAAVPEVSKLIRDPDLGYSLNELGALGKSFTATEMGQNPWMIGQAQALPSAAGFDELMQGLQAEGLFDQTAFTQGEFIERANRALGGDPRKVSMMNQAIAMRTKLSGDKSQFLPPSVQAVGEIGETIKTMDKSLLKETQTKGGIKIDIPLEKIEKLNELYEKQSDIASKLTKAHEDSNRAQAKRLETEKAQVDLEIRKQQGSIYMSGLQQEISGYRDLLTTGQAPAGTVKKLRSAEKEMLALQAEQQQEIADEGVGPYGRAARRLLGGFGLMYARSVFGFATSGLGFGQQERAGLEANIAQGAYSGLGITRTPYNQNMALQNQVALSGQATNPLTSLSQLSAQNPGLRDVYNLGVAGIGAWGFSQYAASTMPAGDPWGRRLTRASPFLGLAAAGLSMGAEMSARADDPAGMAWRMTSGGIPSPLDYATQGFMAMFNRGGAQEVGRMAQIYSQTNRAFDQGLSYEEMSQARAQERRGPRFPGMGLLQAITGQRFTTDAGLLGDKGDYNQSIVRELLQRTPSLTQEAAAQTASFLQVYAPGLSVSDSRVSQVAADYQMGGRAAAYSQQMMMMSGMPASQIYKTQGGIANIGRLQMDLAGMNLDMSQRALIEQGLGRGANVAGISSLAPQYAPGPEQTRVGPGGVSTQISGLQPSAAQNQVDFWTRLGGLSDSQFGAYQAQAQAAELARQANLPGVSGPTFGALEGVTDKYQLATMTAQANANAMRAQTRMDYAQGQMNQSYQFGNLQLGNRLYERMTNVKPGQEWLSNDIYNMDQTTLGYLGTQGMNFNNMPGIGMFGGGRISAGYFNQMDVGLGGQLTGLQYGRTSFAQAGGFGASQMVSNIFGSNWQNNKMFSQGAIQAGLGGQKLLAPITLPNGEVVSSVGGSMGMEMYQDQLNYQHQMSEIGRQGRSNAIQFAFTTGVGLSAYNNTTDPRTGKPFGNLGATGGFWGIEDRQRQMGYAQQEWQFGFQQRQIDVGRRQFNENMGMNIYQSQLQRGWAREDWGFQDQTRNMQWGWKQEDFQEEARFMTGRQRRLAERQMRRDTTMHNLEGDQIERGRGRQEELWKLEDERFKIQRKQHEENTQMQEESLKKQREFFEERKKLEAEQTKLQRAYFIQMQDLQQEAIAAAASYAKENLKLKQTFTQLQAATELTQGQLRLITKDGFEDLREALLDADPALQSIIDKFFKMADAADNASNVNDTVTNWFNNGGGYFDTGQLPIYGMQSGQSAPKVDSYMQDSLQRQQQRDQSKGLEGAAAASFIPMSSSTRQRSSQAVINLFVGNDKLESFVIDTVSQELRA